MGVERPGAKTWSSPEWGVRQSRGGGRRGESIGAVGPRTHSPLPQPLPLSGGRGGRRSLSAKSRGSGSEKEAKGRRGAVRGGGPAGTHCARSGPARSPRRRRSGCAESSCRGPAGPRYTSAAGAPTRPSRSARAAPHPRRPGGARLRPARGRPGPGRGPRRTGSGRSAWHLPRARSSARRSGGEGAGGWAAAPRPCGTERAEAGWPCPRARRPLHAPGTWAPLQLRRRGGWRPATGDLI